MTITYLFAALLGYALGSIPFGLVLTRLAGAGDLRAIGSGNIGATNVLRTGRKGLAAGTLALDMLKGTAAVLVARLWWPTPGAWGVTPADAAAVGAVLGHCFPLWLRFRGGKGVATTLGVSAGLGWPIGLAFALVWLGQLRLWRISSVGGMSAVVAAPLAALALGQRADAVVLAALGTLVIVLHRANIGRLLAGTEPRVGAKPATPAA